MPGESRSTHRLRHSSRLSEYLNTSVMAKVHRVTTLTFHFSMVVRGGKSHVFFHFNARCALFACSHAGRYATGQQVQLPLSRSRSYGSSPVPSV